MWSRLGTKGKIAAGAAALLTAVLWVIFLHDAFVDRNVVLQGVLLGPVLLVAFIYAWRKGWVDEDTIREL